MDNYTFIKTLGRGAQGTTSLVTHNSLEGEFVLKKIECIDEAHAYKAFDQMKKRYKIEHPYLCECKEIFVTWDKKQCAVFLCTVVEYYTCGTLGSFFETQRNEKKYIKEDLILYWLGQIIEAVSYLHSLNIAHMDLKCNNLYLQMDSTILIGDIGIPLVMNEVSSFPSHRIPEDSKLSFAPEIEYAEFTDKSDVWSLGIIGLEMLLCGCYDSKEIKESIQKVKQDSENLNDIFNILIKVYSLPLNNFIKRLLVIDPNERPSMKSLIGLNFTKEVLYMSGSEIVERRKHQAIAAKDNPVPIDNGFEDVVEYIDENSYNELCVKEALQWLVSECSTHEFHNHHKMSIAHAVKDNIVSKEIFQAFLKIFCHHIIYAQENDAVYSKELVETTILGMNTHTCHLDLQIMSCSFLMALSESLEASEIVGEAGGIECLLKAVVGFPHSANLFIVACGALWSLCVLDQNNLCASQCGAMKIICEGMIRHFSIPEAIENASLCILSLSTEQSNASYALEINILYHLLKALENYVGHTKLVKNVLSTLSSLSEVSESYALEILQCRTEKEDIYSFGFPILLHAYSIHKDNIEVVEVFAQLICTFFQYPDLIQMYDQYRFDSDAFKVCFNEIFNRYPSNEVVLRAYQKVLLHMSLS